MGDPVLTLSADPHEHGDDVSRAFLDQHFKSEDDLLRAPLLAVEVSAELEALESSLSHLEKTILDKVAAWASHSEMLSSSLHFIDRKIKEWLDSYVAASEKEPPLGSASLPSQSAFCDKPDIAKELLSLAREVAQVERVKAYAETALRLEALVGDLEDAVRHVSLGTPRIQLPRKLAASSSRDILPSGLKKLSAAVHALEAIEGVITETTKLWPRWNRLFSVVDVRVDSAVSALRPSAVAYYRSQLVAIGWPPPLSMGTVQDDQQRNKKAGNPLLEMKEESKARFEECFFGLSILQIVQLRRKARQLTQVQHEDEVQAMKIKAVKNQGRADELLWTIEELVLPISVRTKHHFLKWSQKPEFIFGLARRIAQQYISSIDEVLQPILDKARLVGYCVRDEWISAIVRMVGEHLRSNLLPQLARNIDEEDASALWLYLVDLAINFDKQMQSLAGQSTGPLAGRLGIELLQDDEPGTYAIAKCISVFAEQPDWLELWAKLEVKDVEEKLKIELSKASAWRLVDGSDLSLEAINTEFKISDEDNKAPHGAEITMLKIRDVISRCQTLPQADWRFIFVRFTVVSLIKKYLDDLIQRCQEAEVMTALVEEGAILKVAVCINAAFYCQRKLLEWSDDIFFVDLWLFQVQAAKGAWGELDPVNAINTEFGSVSDNNLHSVEGSIFYEEITALSRFQADWLGKIVSAIQRSFDASSQEYQRNKKRWQDESSTNSSDDAKKSEVSFNDKLDSHGSTNPGPAVFDITLSARLVDAFAILESRLRVLKQSLGQVIFLDLWRNLASSLDHFFFNTMVLGGAKFSDYGSRQLARDIQGLFQLFKPYCLRPANFFPNLSDAVILLTLSQADAAILQNILSFSTWRGRGVPEDSKLASLKQYGVRFITPGIAGKILSYRLLPRT